MSIQDVLAGPECNLDVYEQPDEEKWVECKLRRGRIGLAIGIPIIIIIIMLFIFFGSTWTKIVALLAGCGLIAMLVLSHFYWTPLAARTEHKSSQMELQARINSGMTKAQALENIQQEKLKKLEISALKRAPEMQTAGLLAIASALHK